METIRTTGNLDKDTEEQLKSVLTAYTDSFVKAVSYTHLDVYKRQHLPRVPEGHRRAG